jgi:hypothetical protein
VLLYLASRLRLGGDSLLTSLGTADEKVRVGRFVKDANVMALNDFKSVRNRHGGSNRGRRRRRLRKGTSAFAEEGVGG